MTMTHRARILAVPLGLLGTVLSAAAALALPAYGPFEVQGNLQTQVLVRHPDVDKYQFVQNRNTLRLRLDYNMVENGRLIQSLDVPWIRTAHLYLLYRGVYDSAYDIVPGGYLRDIHKEPAGRLKDLTSNQRDGLRYENVLREAYLDVDLRDLPLSFRLGRQQVVWGEADNFRMLDRANPLDLTWHQTFESWDDLRVPLWIIKALWRVGYVGPLSDVFVEAYWNPGDWTPAKQGFMPEYPWGVSQTDPRAELYAAIGALIGRPVRSLYRGTDLFRRGDYHRNPGDNSQVGVRISAVTPQGLQFTLNYFRQRWAGDDGTNYAPVRALTDPDQIEEAILRAEAPAIFIAPYVHTVGLSLNYADEDWTQTVYRLETIYDFGVPFSDSAKPAGFAPLKGEIFGVTKRDMWKGMIAFDRPTWIRAINRTSTIFFTGQFFWHYLVDREPTFVGNVGPAVADKVRNWEMVFTLLASTFYAGGSVVPTLVYALDPVNSYNMYVGWTVDWYITNQVIARLGQNFFLAAGSQPAYESWSLGGFNRGRSETLARLTYQF